MTPDDMPVVAELICRVLVRHEPPECVKPDVVALRKRFQTLCFMR